MIRRMGWGLVAGAVAVAMGIGGAYCAAAPSVYPTGTTIYNPAKAYSCYVVFSAPDGKTHVIDMDGNEVHRWNYFGFPPEIIDPGRMGGAKGHLIVQTKNGAGAFGGIFANEEVVELDWEGNVVWRWGAQAPGGKARQNHDWDRLANHHTLLLTTTEHVIPSVSDKPLADQTIQEVDAEGKVVWSWTAGDHLDEFGISPEGRALLRAVFANGSGGVGFLTINDMQPLGPNKWFDAGDQRFNPENIMIDSREGSFIAIIEKKTGKVVWRLGPDYGETAQSAGGTASVSSAAVRPVLETKVPRPMDQTSGQHDAHLIPEGLPGAGDLLVFDNEGPAGYPPTRIATQLGSRVLEINPVTREIVWQYTGVDSGAPLWTFFSSFISSARRLPNGNTLIDEGMNGRLFQVTPQGEIVWEYVNPYYGMETMGPSRDLRTNWVFRAQPVPYDWLPIAGRPAETAVKPVDNATFRVPQQ